MRLVICPHCETQYDVSTLDAPELACRCGALVKTEAPRGVNAAVVRCGACGAGVVEGARSCAYCGAEVVRTGPRSLICPKCLARNDERSKFCTACGVEFRPEPPPGKDEPVIGCVRGCGPTHATRVGGVLVHECGVCHGTWIPENRLEDLVGRIGRGTVALSSPNLESAALAEAGRIEYRRCPLCKAHMARQNFQRISGVVVDRCPEHGTWLDSDELPRIAAFVSEGGLVRAAAAKDEERARLARSAAFRARIEATTPHHARTELNVSMARSFTQMFQKLLSGDHGGD